MSGLFRHHHKWVLRGEEDGYAIYQCSREIYCGKWKRERGFTSIIVIDRDEIRRLEQKYGR